MDEHDYPNLEKDLEDFERYMDSIRDDAISEYQKEKDGQ